MRWCLRRVVFVTAILRKKCGFSMSKGDGDYEGRNYLAHRIGLDFFFLPGQQWPSKTITVQGSRRAWLINFFTICHVHLNLKNTITLLT